MSDQIEKIVNQAFTLSKDYRHQYVTIEHLLAIIMDTPEVTDILMDMGVESMEVSRSIYDYLEQELDKYLSLIHI